MGGPLGWWRDGQHARRVERENPGAHVHRGAQVVRTPLGSNATVYAGAVLVDCALGSFSYVAAGSELRATRVGKFCSIGPGVKCGLGAHPAERFVSTHPAFFSIARQATATFADRSYFDEVAQVEIGNDVWIAANSVIVNGVKIGDGAIIAAGAVVSADVAPYTIAGGVPAKPIRPRFDVDEIEFLLAFRWWDKPESWLRENFRDFHDVKAFLRTHRR